MAEKEFVPLTPLPALSKEETARLDESFMDTFGPTEHSTEIKQENRDIDRKSVV